MRLILLFVIGVISLILFSRHDLKKKEVSPRILLWFLLFGLGFQLGRQEMLATLIGIAIMGIFGFVLWHFKVIGGGDAKMLPIVVFYLPIFGIPNTIVTVFIFMLALGVIGISYGLLYNWRYADSEEEEIPFMPVITLVYALVWLLQD